MKISREEMLNFLEGGKIEHETRLAEIQQSLHSYEAEMHTTVGTLQEIARITAHLLSLEEKETKEKKDGSK